MQSSIPFPVALSAVLLAGLVSHRGARPAPHEKAAPPPNILILVADDMGVDMMPAYAEGSDLPITPALDGLANSGLLFRHAWANPNCSPTRAALLTGRHAFRTGVGNFITPTTEALRPSEITIPELLRIAGTSYVSGAFGKWHLGNETNGGILAPNVAGFDHYDGCLLGDLNQPNNNAFGFYDWPRTVNGVRTQDKTYATTATVNAASQWIQTQTQPWFAYVSFNAPHFPLHTPPAGLYTEDLTGLSVSTSPRPFYKAAIEAIDAEIGRLLSEINGQLGDTLVIFLGDNGTQRSLSVAPFVPSHGKATVYEGGVNVPFVIAGPGVTAGESDALVCVTDLFNTIARLAEISAEIWMPGVALDSFSLLPYFADPATPSRRPFAYTERFVPVGATGPVVQAHRAIRGPRYKIVSLISGYQFYDLWSDPFEQVDLLNSELSAQQHQRFGYLRSKMNSLIGSPRIKQVSLGGESTATQTTPLENW